MAGDAKTIILSPADGMASIKEALADAGITPGMLIERTATGIKKHATVQGENQRMFATENVADAGTIDRDYVTGETASFVYATSGYEINGLVINGTPAIAENDLLASDGAGGVKISSAASAIDAGLVGRALLAVDNSGGSAPVRIKIEVM